MIGHDGGDMNRTRAMAQRARDLSMLLDLTPPFRPEVFVARLATNHGLTILLIAFHMLESVTGYVLRPSETDYIIFYDPASVYRSIYHECGHIVLDHVPIAKAEEIEQFLSLSNIQLLPALLRSRFGKPKELDAEAFSIAMTALSTATTATVPSTRSLLTALEREKPSAIGQFYDEMGL